MPRLFGKYSFETLRDCMQGTFTCNHDITKDEYIIQAWFITLIIKPHNSITIYISSSKDEALIEIGKITLS